LRLAGSNLALHYDEVVVATDLSIEVPDGQVSVLIGPNGSGKSTLLRALARLLKPKGGAVVLDGREIHEYSTKEVARRLAILPQTLISPESITVEELVAYGRFPQRRTIGGMRDEDREAIDWALTVTGMRDLRDRPVDQLSGGQRQRAWIALVLAQGTDLILLDEPTTFLDIAYQLEVLELLRHLNEAEGKTIVMVLHDINMAAEYAHHLFAMKSGQIVAQGAPKEIICRELVREVFGIDSHILVHPDTDNPLCVPIPEPGHVPSDDEDADRELSAPVG
jgi:ABC-type cobalamin/Fe3+-siderophores transport system ATPase subunit